MRSLIQPQDRLGLSGPEAAEFIGVGYATFLVLAEDGRMPKARSIGARKLWDRREIEKAFAALPIDGVDDGGWEIT